MVTWNFPPATDTSRWVALATLLLMFGCDELEPIELGPCGNGVLDPGEDCDGFDHPEGTACAPPTADNACRYTCDKSCEASDCEQPAICPVGWGCGIDGICRQPSGAFEDSFSDLGVLAAPWMRATDLNGDGRDDLALLELTGARAAYSQGRGLRPESFRFALSPSGLPDVTDVDRDGFRDLVVPTIEGLAVLRGTAESRLRPGIYPTLRIPSGEYRFVRLDLVAPVNQTELFVGPGDEQLAMFDGGFIRTSLAEPAAIPFVHAGATVDVVDEIVAGQIDETTASEEAVVAFAGRDAVDVYAFDVGLDQVDVSVSTIQLGQGVVIAAEDPDDYYDVEPLGVRLVHANAARPDAGGDSALCCDADCMNRAPGDDHLDVVISTTQGLQTAYGLGDGTFHSNPCSLGLVEPDGYAAKSAPKVAVGEGCEVLAVADLDDDGRLDVVTTQGIWLTTLLPPGATLCDESEGPAVSAVTRWRAAGIADMNADGHSDAVAISVVPGDIDVVLGSSSPALSTVTVARSLLSLMARFGDFDGDGADDVALLSQPSLVDPYAQELSILWGEPGGAPDTIQVLGRLPLVQDMGTTSQRPIGSPTVDVFDDLVIVSEEYEVEGAGINTATQQIRTGELLGRHDRQLVLPFRPTDDGGASGQVTEAIYAPFGVVAGRFSFAEEGTEALATAVRFLGGAEAKSADPAILAIALSSPGTTAVPPNASAPLVSTDPASLGPERSQRYLMAAVDLGGDFEQPISFEFVDGVLGTRVQAPAFTGATWDVPSATDLPNAIPVGALITDDTSTLAAFSPFIPNTPQGCALGHPGGEHLLLLMVDDEPGGFIDIGGQSLFPVDNRTALYVFSPEDLRAIQSGGTSVSPTVVTSDFGLASGFACLDLDGDGVEEVVTATAQIAVLGVGLLGTRVRLETFEYATGDDGPGLTPLRTLATFDEASFEAVATTDFAGAPAQGMVSGDLDGDGVDDLVVGAYSTTLVLYGKAVNP